MPSFCRGAGAGVFLALALIILAVPAIAASHITLVVNGQVMTTDVPPQIVDQRTLVPIRFVSESLGLDVQWDAAARTVTITGSDRRIVLTVGDTSATVDGTAVTLDVPAQIVDGRTMVPVRFVAETFAAVVQWDEGTRTVSIDAAAGGGSSSGGGEESEAPTRRIRVEVFDYGFDAETIQVAQGTEVTLEVIGVEGVHTLTIDAFDVDVRVAAGETQTVTFTAAESGTFRMYCRYHPGMEGSFVVSD